MRFTPTAILGSQQLSTTFGFDTPSGATTGTFTSGGIDYNYLKFTSGSYTLNVTSGAEVDLLIVGGGGGGRVLTSVSGEGGGGGGVYYGTSKRLYKGTYTVYVGPGGRQNEFGSGSFITSYGVTYSADAGNNVGGSGNPTPHIAGNAVGVSKGGGGGAYENGLDANPNGYQGGKGGEGLTLNFDGTPSVYGSGGGGGGRYDNPGVPYGGGAGGTNAGNGYTTISPTGHDGVNGFGGGGGGCSTGNFQVAGRGGHGIIIIRYRT